MMNFEKYTNSSKKIINSAQNLALSKKHQKIAPIYIFNELLNSNHELINKIFEKINTSIIKTTISEILSKEQKFKSLEKMENLKAKILMIILTL